MDQGGEAGNGGLLNDPVQDNVGLSPDAVQSPIDFDSDGCRDYPPPQKDNEGKCIEEGKPIPSDPTGA